MMRTDFRPGVRIRHKKTGARSLLVYRDMEEGWWRAIRYGAGDDHLIHEDDIEVFQLKVYVASSWRNYRQPEVVDYLRQKGYEVYDFRNPKEGDNGFSWREIDDNWKNWTSAQFIEGLKHPVAQAGFKSDMDALEACDACVLVLPCGRSAHLELGQAVGAKKNTYVLLDESPLEPELMYLMCTALCTSLDQLYEKMKEREW
jgi:hypothetical protein